MRCSAGPIGGCAMKTIVFEVAVDELDGNTG
jgi:hypothetical protein